LLSDLGGIRDIVIATLGLILFPYSQFSYNLKAFSKLYLAETVDEDLFIPVDTDK
jgi:hypothetical protein